jgi:cyclopropane fatty-acyl-phospholipid synthase-like methyltransferase
MNEKLTKYIADQYDNFQTTLETISKNKKYLNYGYTITGKESYEERQEQLCQKVFFAARIQPSDTIVDVGFGSGEQDFLLAKGYDFKKVIGINISKRQVDYASSQAKLLKLDSKLIFKNAPAEDMKDIGDNSIDKIISIECAFYFERSKFYKEAARILKPGGLLVLADITFSNKLRLITNLSNDLMRVSCLDKNKDEWEKYFSTSFITKINKYTYPGAQMSVIQIIKLVFLQKLDHLELKQWLKMAFSSQIVVLGLLTGLINYHLIVLEKLIHE